MGQYGGTCAKSNILCLLDCGFIMGQQVYEQPGAEGVEVEMTKEELQQLILIMGTITVISFILVITLSSIIIVFIWFSQKQLTRRCYCSKLETAPCAQGKTIQHEKDITRDYEKNYIGENEIRGNNLKTNVMPVRMFEVNLGPYNRNKNLIVNPLPAVQPYPQTNWARKSLMKKIAQSLSQFIQKLTKKILK